MTNEEDENPTAWKSHLKEGAGESGRGRRNLRHGSPTSKEEQVREGRGRRTLWHGSPTSKKEQVGEEEDEEPYGMEVLLQRKSRWGRKRTKNPTARKSYLKGEAGD